MSYSVQFTEATLRDIEDILEYLNDISEKFGELFLFELINYVSHLQANPELFRVLRTEYRRVYMKQFHYHVIYKIDSDQKEVRIIAIAHESKHQRRLGS